MRHDAAGLMRHDGLSARGLRSTSFVGAEPPPYLRSNGSSTCTAWCARARQSPAGREPHHARTVPRANRPVGEPHRA
eukprot:4810825-Prymnesium_polylepis.2